MTDLHSVPTHIEVASHNMQHYLIDAQSVSNAR